MKIINITRGEEKTKYDSVKLTTNEIYKTKRKGKKYLSK